MGVTLSRDGCFPIAPGLPELCSSSRVTRHSLILLGFAFAIGSCLVVPAVLGPGLLFPLDRGKTCQCPAQGLCFRVCPVQLCQLWTLCSVIDPCWETSWTRPCPAKGWPLGFLAEADTPRVDVEDTRPFPPGPRCSAV